MCNKKPFNSSIFGYLTTFHSIVNEGNISKASRKLGISIPAVSNALKALEKHIGLPLFYRSTRSLELTEAGQHLYANTFHLTAQLEQEIEKVQDLNNTPTGTVRLTVPRSAYYSIIKPYYAEFCQQYPNLLLEISLADNLVDLVKEGFDLGIRFGDKIEDNMVACQLLPEMQDCLVVCADYAKKHGIPRNLQALQQHKLIGYRFSTTQKLLPLMLQRDNQQFEVKMPTSIIVNDDAELMVDATRQGLGIGRIFQSILDLQPDKADFIPLLQDYWISYPPIYLYYLQNSQKLKRIKVLIDFLRHKCQMRK